MASKVIVVRNGGHPYELGFEPTHRTIMYATDL